MMAENYMIPYAALEQADKVVISYPDGQMSVDDPRIYDWKWNHNCTTFYTFGTCKLEHIEYTYDNALGNGGYHERFIFGYTNNDYYNPIRDVWVKRRDWLSNYDKVFIELYKNIKLKAAGKEFQNPLTTEISESAGFIKSCLLYLGEAKVLKPEAVKNSIRKIETIGAGLFAVLNKKVSKDDYVSSENATFEKLYEEYPVDKLDPQVVPPVYKANPRAMVASDCAYNLIEYVFAIEQGFMHSHAMTPEQATKYRSQLHLFGFTLPDFLMESAAAKAK